MYDRTFGIEIEAHLPEGKTKGQLADMIRRRTGLPARVEGYSHNTAAHWKLTTDGSLDDDYDKSVEIVSPILRGDAGLAEARKVAEVVEAFGCWVDVKCGLHVHVGGSDLSVDELRKVAVNFVHSESAFDVIMPPSRRKDMNSFIQSNRTAFGGAYENEAINKAIDAYGKADTRDKLIYAVSYCTDREYHTDRCSILQWRATARYRKLNMLPLLRLGTIEFRQHGGTVNPDKICNWVELCVAFIEISRKSQPRKRTAMRPQNVAKELSVLLHWLQLSPEARKFFLARKVELADRRTRKWAFYMEAHAENDRRTEELAERRANLEYRMAHAENARRDRDAAMTEQRAVVRRERVERARRLAELDAS
jgi:hypothetical protein